MITEADKAWVAGILDLRALTFQVKSGKAKRKYLELQVSTLEPRIAARLYKLSGREFRPSNTHRYPNEWMKRACSEHCQQFHVQYESLRPMHQWQVRGTAAAIIMWNVLPYMTHTDLGFRELIAEVFARTPYHGKPGNAPRAVIRRLHKVGWKMPPQIQHILDVAEM
jgi:hypothetical protein